MTGFDGYRREDGGVGTRNLLVVVSLIDLANDLAWRIAQALGAVAVLTPAGGLSHGAQAALLERLRRRLVANANVGAVLVVGAAGEALSTWPGEIADSGRQSAAIGIAEVRDSEEGVALGVGLGGRMLDRLAAQARVACPLSALRVGLRSSSSSLESARLGNATVGAVVDRVVAAGGAVAFSELADVAWVVEDLEARAAPGARTALLAAMAGPRRLLEDMLVAPDPTPTNRAGGIDTLEQKGRGSLLRLGTAPIVGVFGYGEAMAEAGLLMMEGPGSAAISLTGLAAAGCSMLLYNVGMSAVAAASPLMPVVKVGPPALKRSGDVDLAVPDPPGRAGARLLALLRAAASGRETAGERDQARMIMLPEFLPDL